MKTCRRSEEENRLLLILEPFCARHGFQIVDLRWTTDRKLTLFVDHLIEGPAVTVEECSAVSETVSGFLDVEDPIDSSYTLEVSSPGLERPLRTEAHFRQFLGREIRFRLVRGRMETDASKVPQYNYVGILKAVSDEGAIQVQTESGLKDFMIDSIERANLTFAWGKEVQDRHDVQ